MSDVSPAGEYVTSRHHLLDELVRAELLLRRYLEDRWADVDDHTDDIPGFFISDQEVDRLLTTPSDALARVSGYVEGRGRAAAPSREATRLDMVTEQIRHRAVQSLDRGVELRLLSLAGAFDLSPLELDALSLALGPDLDPKYEKVYGYLRDDATQVRPTVDLLLRTLTYGDNERLSIMDLYAQRSPMIRNRLLRIDPGRTISSSIVRVEERVIEYLLGSDAVADALDDVAVIIDPADGPPELYIDDDRRETLNTITGRLRPPGNAQAPVWLTDEVHATHDPMSTNDDHTPIMAAFVGPDERNAEAAVHHVCAAAEIPVLRIDGRRLRVDDVDEVFRIANREAHLQSAAIHVAGFGALETTGHSSHEDGEGSRADDDLSSHVLNLLDGVPGAVFLSGDAEVSAAIQPRLKHHRFAQVAFPAPTYDQRRAMWAAVSDLPDSTDPGRLAATFRLTRGDIEDAVISARAMTGGPLTATALRDACQFRSRLALNDLAREIEPNYDWEDIVLPAGTIDHLHEIAGAMRHRGTVFEEWGFADRFSLGNGINVLFTGKSGTGKTMAAEIIANEVGLPLYKLDLSTILSKYIGETEKNLGRVFDAAKDSNAILFFDEADALFGKRTEISDAHDCYANVEVDYLLQRMEEHDGCIILASNLKENIDEAFRRRINASVNFPTPDERARLEIWLSIFPEETPTNDIDAAFLAQFELSGGYIKNVALTAAFLAAEAEAPVSMEHVVRALQRELQKAGRLYDLDAFGEYRELLE